MIRLTRTTSLSAFGLSALILAAVGVAVVLGIHHLVVDGRWVSYTHNLLENLEAVQASVKEAEAAQRGYLITEEPRFLGEFAAAREKIERNLGDVIGMTRDDPEMGRRALELQSLVETRYRLNERAIEVWRDEGLPGARDFIRRNQSAEAARSISRLIEQMQAAERILLIERSARTERSASRLRSLAVLGISLSLILLGGLYLLMSREVRRRARAEYASVEARDRLEVTVEELGRTTADLQALSRYAGMLQSCRNTEEALEITEQTLSALLPDCAGTIYLQRASRDYVEAVLEWGEHGATSSQLFAPDDCWALRRGQWYFAENVEVGVKCAHIELPPPDRHVTTTCVPMTAQSETLGLLYVSRIVRANHPAPGAHLPVIQTAAEQLSLALFNLKLQESLRTQSIRDPLTGLFNRRYLEESLTRELARCGRRGLPLVVMMIDLDHFKRFNDTHGHDAGDALLARFGLLLRANSRSEDIACRYGGEEFTLILPEATPEVAMARAETIRAAVRELRIEHLRERLGNLTCSIGLAVFPEYGTTGAELLRQADAALYRAKHNGRDRVEMAA